MANPFLQSIFVQPRVVLGRKLQHFSAFHVAALTILESPFWRGGTVTRDNLVVAAFVCTLQYPHGASALFPEPDIDLIAKWGKEAAALDVDHEQEKFTAYMDDYTHMPDMWREKDGAGKTSGVPVANLIVSTVMMHMAITLKEAWNMPFSELVGYKTAIAEANGAKIVSDKDRVDIAAAAEMNKQAEADNDDA